MTLAIRGRRIAPRCTTSTSTSRPARRWRSSARPASGKTTLVQLLPRLYDVSAGAVLIDGADVRDVDLASLRAAIAVVDDDPVPVQRQRGREHRLRARRTPRREEIELAARRAQAHDFIERLPDGYDTRVGERGLTLSGGQRQRLAIARALLADPRILILDDATSSVDASTEQEIKQALREVMAGRTTFVIAHRLSTISLADEIVVLEDGDASRPRAGTTSCSSSPSCTARSSRRACPTRSSSRARSPSARWRGCDVRVAKRPRPPRAATTCAGACAARPGAGASCAA